MEFPRPRPGDPNYDPELERQLSHPAIKQYMKAMQEVPGLFADMAPTPFHMIIKDWEEQQELQREKREIIWKQPHHILTLPGYVIEYCRFHPSMRKPQKAEPKPVRGYAELFMAIIAAIFHKEPEPTPQLAGQQLEAFFLQTNQKIKDLLAANPDVKLADYEETLEISVIRFDTPKPPEPPPAPKPIKGFIT